MFSNLGILLNDEHDGWFIGIMAERLRFREILDDFERLRSFDNGHLQL